MPQTNHNKTYISHLALTLLTISAVDSIRNLPGTALFGSQIIFFVIASALFFLIPCALVAAELSARRTDCGGIYVWIKSAFGKKMGLLAVWLQWINTLTWFPTVLSFIATTLTYLFFPDLKNNKFYFIAVILIVFWGVTFINLYGIKKSARFSSLCAIFGIAFPLLLIISLGLCWAVTGHPIQISLKPEALLPNFSHSNSWFALTAIITSFLGIELSSAHIQSIKNPQRTFPRVIFISTGVIIFLTITGSLSVSFVIPQTHISLLTGVVESFTIFLSNYHMSVFLPWLIGLIAIGSIGGMVNWMISPNRNILLAINDGMLPRYFGKLNKNHVPYRLSIFHASAVSVISLTLLLEPNIRSFYSFLTALSTQIYIMLYILMFVAALYLRRKSPLDSAVFKVPGGRVGIWICCGMGLVGCAIALVTGFFPPPKIAASGYMQYEVSLITGQLILCAPPILIVLYQYAQESRVAVKKI